VLCYVFEQTKRGGCDGKEGGEEEEEEERGAYVVLMSSDGFGVRIIWHGG
jgi:hypothetical protein